MINEENKIALFDLDGTLADYNGQLRQDLARIRSLDEGSWDFTGDLYMWPRY